jgi:glutamate/aspartate transport system substrate-binding protein
MKKSLIALLLSSTFLAVPALAQNDKPANRLDRIKETRILVAGYREMGVPFSYLNNGKPAGFGVELTERVAAAIRQQLDAPDVRIRWNAVTLSTRIPMITTNTVDIACSTDTHTRARAELVGFSVSFYITDTGMAVAKSANIKDLQQMQGKRIAVPAGSTVEAALRETSAKNNLNLTLVPARNNRLAMQLVQRGEADGYVNADTIVAGELFRLPDADKFEVVNIGGYQEAFGCMLPKGDAAFKKVVDEVLVGMMKSGEMEALYTKWFVKPVPPFGQALNLPINASTRALYQAPNDTPLE